MSWLSYDDIQAILIFLGLFFIACVYYKRTIPMDYEDFHPPTLRTLPVIGSLPFLPHPRISHIWFLNKLQTMGEVIGFYAMSKYFIVIQSRQALNEAYVKRSKEFASRPKMYVFHRLNPRMRGLIHRPYDESCKRYHRLTLSILRSFGLGDHSVMETRINREVEHLLTEFREQRCGSICPKMAVNGSVANVIASILFGRRFESNDPGFQSLVKNIDQFSISLMKTMPANVFPLARFLPTVKSDINHVVRLHDWLLEFLRRKVEESRSISSSNNDEENFIRSFLKVDDDVEELVFIVRDLIVAGTETSSTTVMWAIALLADHREVQVRVHEEIDALHDGNDDVDGKQASSLRLRRRLPSLADRTRMPYVEATVLEVMRFKTIAPMGLPRVTSDEVDLDGYAIPKGTMVLPNLYAMHMDPAVWRDPNVFRPERFLDNEGNVKANMKDLVIPFSIGKRSCLGELLARQEIFLFVTGLLQNFEILPPDGQVALNCTDTVGLAVAPSAYKVRFLPRKMNSALLQHANGSI